VKYADVQTFVQAGLEAKSYGATPMLPLPMFDPGPALASRVALSPGPILFLTLGNGIGLTTEALFDRRFLVVRVVGAQHDYDYAETLAGDVDHILLDQGGTVTMGSTRLLYCTRNGSPQLVDYDASERHHFQATYIVEAPR
jgi:hypothetical protein